MTAAPDGDHGSHSSALNVGGLKSFQLSANICTLKKEHQNLTLSSLLLRLKVLLQLSDRVLQSA